MYFSLNILKIDILNIEPAGIGPRFILALGQSIAKDDDIMKRFIVDVLLSKNSRIGGEFFNVVVIEGVAVEGVLDAVEISEGVLSFEG